MMKFSILQLAVRPLSAAVILVGALAPPMVLAQAAPVAAAPAHFHGHPHRGHGHGLSPKVLQSIGASADQQSKIMAIQAQTRADLRQQHQAAGNVHHQLAQALAAPTVDAAAAESARQKIVAQNEAFSQRMLQARLQIAAILTPDQRQQLLAMEQQRASQWQGRHRQQQPASNAS
jgi:Spy/CpxP family protein refolding chaperone